MAERRRPLALRPPEEQAAALARDRERALALTPVSRETAARLDRFVILLLRWQRRLQLVAHATVPVLWTRHIADSLQLLRLAPTARCWVDLGSGGGFPGVPIACALADTPGAVVHLVESNARKCAFLREAARITGAPVQVHCCRIRAFVTRFTARADVVTARALAPLAELLAEAAPLLKTGALGLFPKGQDVGAELTAAAKYWKLDVSVEPSVTSPASGILVVKGVEARAAHPLP